MIAALLLAAVAPPSPLSLGVHDGWGAFRSGDRCYAIAAPQRTAAASRWRPFASVATRTGSGRRGLFVRLSAERLAATPVTLSVGERRFALTGRGNAVGSPDAATDRAIVAALRGQTSMSVEAVSASGRPFADSYALAGAATAIDAAALGCLAPR